MACGVARRSESLGVVVERVSAEKAMPPRRATGLESSYWSVARKARAASAAAVRPSRGEGLGRHSGGVGVQRTFVTGEAARGVLDVLEEVQALPGRGCGVGGESLGGGAADQRVARDEQRLDGEGRGVRVADAAVLVVDRAAETTVGALLVEQQLHGIGVEPLTCAGERDDRERLADGVGVVAVGGLVAEAPLRRLERLQLGHEVVTSEGRGVRAGHDGGEESLRQGTGVHLAERADVGAEVGLEVVESGVGLGLLGADRAQRDDRVDRVATVEERALGVDVVVAAAARVLAMNAAAASSSEDAQQGRDGGLRGHWGAGRRGRRGCAARGRGRRG